MINRNRKATLAIITAIVVIAAGAFVLISMHDDSVNRGPLWEAVVRTLGPYDETNPVKDDLIKRGLVSLEGGNGYIEVGEIEELVREEVYVIDEQGYLQLGPTSAERSFEIRLADSGELVLSREHIRTYDTAGHAIELNESGIEKWNSFQNYTAEPKLTQSLYLQDFVLKIDGVEVARGIFYSGLSSTSYQGLALVEVLGRLDSEHAKLQFITEYPGLYFGEEYNGLSSKLAEVFAQNQSPVEVVSVTGPLEPINPGGPVVEIRLKNVSSSPVVSLNVLLDLGAHSPFEFDFDVTPSNPVLPGRSASAEQILIGGGFSDNLSYPLEINGTLQGGETFTCTTQVQISPHAGFPVIIPVLVLCAISALLIYRFVMPVLRRKRTAGV